MQLLDIHRTFCYRILKGALGDVRHEPQVDLGPHNYSFAACHNRTWEK
jgi:hypothetical protein